MVTILIVKRLRVVSLPALLATASSLRRPRITDPAVENVAALISGFDFDQPVAVNEEGTLIAGYSRLKADVLIVEKSACEF
jgi:hypothetical protein